MRKIKQIIFYADNKERKSIIIYSDNKIQKASENVGKEKIKEYCNQENIKSLSDSRVKSNVLFLTKTELLKKIATFDKKNDTENKKNYFKTNVADVTVKHTGIKKLALYSALIAIIFSNTKGKLRMVDVYDFIFNRNRNEQDYLRKMKSADEYSNAYEILAMRNINLNKSKYISNIWRSLKDYNVFLANRYNYKNQKLAHSFEEIESEYLMFNMLDVKQMNDIYLDGELDVLSLKENYKAATKEDIKYRIVQFDSFPTSILIQNDENKDTYYKYENILIKFNRETRFNRKKKLANTFFKTVRNDFRGKTDISNTYLPVKSIIDAMQIMCDNTKEINSLTKKEKVKLNKLYDAKIEENYQRYLTYKFVNKVTDEDVSVSVFKDVALRKLNDGNNYNLNLRDISKNKVYKKQLNWKYNSDKN